MPVAIKGVMCLRCPYTSQTPSLSGFSHVRAPRLISAISYERYWTIGHNDNMQSHHPSMKIQFGPHASLNEDWHHEENPYGLVPGIWLAYGSLENDPSQQFALLWDRLSPAVGFWRHVWTCETILLYCISYNVKPHFKWKLDTKQS